MCYLFIFHTSEKGKIWQFIEIVIQEIRNRNKIFYRNICFLKNLNLHTPFAVSLCEVTSKPTIRLPRFYIFLGVSLIPGWLLYIAIANSISRKLFPVETELCFFQIFLIFNSIYEIFVKKFCGFNFIINHFVIFK